MSKKNNSQSTQNYKSICVLLFVIILMALVANAIIYVWQCSQMKFFKQSLQQQISALQIQITKLQQTQLEQKEEKKTKKLQSYTSENLGISFQYPQDWYIEEDESDNRIYIKNFQGKRGRDNRPENFQQLWISTSSEEAISQRENDLKAGKPSKKHTDLITSSIGLSINTYEYKTIDGSVLEAFWNNKNGKKYYATHSTEISPKNQENMVENLKMILSTVKFISEVNTLSTIGSEIGSGKIFNDTPDKSIEDWKFTLFGTKANPQRIQYSLIINENCSIHAIGFQNRSCEKYLKNTKYDLNNRFVGIYGKILPNQSIKVSNIIIQQ